MTAMTAQRRPDPLASARNRDILHACRALGILQVIWFHVIIAVARLAPEGAMPGIIDRIPGVLNPLWQAMGVDLIFMVSALLLGLSLLSEAQDTGRISLRAHAIKRLSRILPLYWLALLVYALAEGRFGGDFWRSALFAGHILGDRNVIPVGWSMEVIILVYMALPFAVMGLLRSRRPWLWLAGALALTSLPRLAYLVLSHADAAGFYPVMLADRTPPPAAFDLYFRPWFRLSPFVIGLGLAFALSRGWRPPLRPFLWLLSFAGLVYGTGLPIHDADSWPYRMGGPVFWSLFWAFCHTIFALGAAGVIWLAVTGHGTARLPLHRLWQAISQAIFPIYLFHMPIIALAAIPVYRSTDLQALAGTTVAHVLATGVLTAALTLGLAMLLNRYVEAPLQTRLRRRFLGNAPK